MGSAPGSAPPTTWLGVKCALPRRSGIVRLFGTQTRPACRYPSSDPDPHVSGCLGVHIAYHRLVSPSAGAGHGGTAGLSHRFRVFSVAGRKSSEVVVRRESL